MPTIATSRRCAVKEPLHDEVTSRGGDGEKGQGEDTAPPDRFGNAPPVDCDDGVEGCHPSTQGDDTSPVQKAARRYEGLAGVEVTHQGMSLHDSEAGVTSDSKQQADVSPSGERASSDGEKIGKEKEPTAHANCSHQMIDNVDTNKFVDTIQSNEGASTIQMPEAALHDANGESEGTIATSYRTDGAGVCSACSSDKDTTSKDDDTTCHRPSVRTLEDKPSVHTARSELMQNATKPSVGSHAERQEENALERHTRGVERHCRDEGTAESTLTDRCSHHARISGVHKEDATEVVLPEEGGNTVDTAESINSRPCLPHPIDVHEQSSSKDSPDGMR